MKKLILLAVAFFAITTAAIAQNEGLKANYKYTFGFDQSVRNVVLYLADNNTRMEYYIPGSETAINTYILKGDELIALDNSNPNKGKAIVTQVSNRPNVKPDFTYQITKETKQILGNKCTKIIIKSDLVDIVTWVATDIKADYNSSIAQVLGYNNGLLPEGIQGLPLQIYITDKKGGESKMEATALVKQTPAASIFQIPANYTILNRN